MISWPGSIPMIIICQARFNSAVAAFESNPQAVMVYGNMLAVDQTGQTINQLHYRQLTLEDLLCFQIIGQPAVFMRRAAFEKAGGLDLDFHFMLDHQLWIKLAAQGPNRSCQSNMGRGALSSAGEESRSSSRICTRGFPRFGLGGNSIRSCSDIAPRPTPRSRFGLSCQCALPAR